MPIEQRIIELPESAEGGFFPRGGARKLWDSRDPEVILVGPAETGKTYSALKKLDALMVKYPGAQAAVVRKTFKSMAGSVLQTYEKKVLPQQSGVIPYGGTRVERYIYPNGSTIWLGGMDNPDKVLSSERDIIYVNQAEELTAQDWETLTTRVTGRAGNMPYAQMIGDANPAGSKHWIRERAKRGSLKLLTSKHQDNPTLFDRYGQPTEQGKITLARLASLTGVRYKRLFLGEWATAEGAVYEMFDHSVHVRERDPNEFVEWVLAMDEGYTNPAVILLIGIDPDGRLHIFREFYQSGVLQSRVVTTARAWALEWRVTDTVVDAAAAGLIAELTNNGVWATPHKGRVLDGIALVQDLLTLAGDGRPRLTVEPSCEETINEFESYVWKLTPAGGAKDEPVKEFDHALDALRYYVSYKFGGTRGGFGDNPFGDYRG